ncbi:hypothetical protein HanPI659440_Chr14g0569511 [Helianthus annuus]|nr:hypothetical protein HanPI659440_Chr14g0569511 [Helianthus annuus]
MKSCAHSSSVLSLSLKSLNGVLVEWIGVQETPVGSASGVGFVSTANNEQRRGGVSISRT